MGNRDRSNAFLLNLTHRPFVDGTGPLPPVRTGGLARNYSIAAKIILAGGGAFILWALIGNNLLMIYPAVVFFAFAVVFLAFDYSFRKTKQKWAELGARGILLDAELSKASIKADEGSNYLICHYRFTSPSGTVLTGNTLISCPDGLNTSNLPLPCTPMAVVYVDDDTFEVL